MGFVANTVETECPRCSNRKTLLRDGVWVAPLNGGEDQAWFNCQCCTADVLLDRLGVVVKVGKGK